MKIPGILFLIAAPSGAGKTALVTSIIQKLSDHIPLKRVITYTCRHPRLGEVPGRDYHFLTPEEFEKRTQQNYFLEWSEVYGTYYGSPSYIKDDLAAGKSLFMIVDRAGLHSMVQHVPHAVRIWIEVPSLAALKERLILRGTDAPEKIERRLMLAEQEMDEEKQQKLCHYSVMNDDFTRAVLELEGIVRTHLEQHFKQGSPFDRLRMTG